MKKTMRFLSLAVLALVGAIMTGCSNEDDFTVEPENKSNVVTLTTTVGIGGGAGTRALTADGVKTFAAGETMAVIYKNTSGTTVKAVSAALTADDILSGSDNKTATFTFELTDPNKTQNVTYIYPASMAKADGTVNYDALNSQNGTLATLSSSLDLATYSAAWDGASLPSATLENQLAFLAITLKNADGSNEITSSITGMTISDGTNTYTITPSSLSTIYVAIKPTTSANIDITANDGSQCYNKSLTGKTYEASNGYNVSWRMAPAALNLTSPAVGQVIGNDGKNYDYASLPGGVTAVAKICYVSGSNVLALALADETGTMYWSTAISTCAAHTPAFTGGTWKLATKDEWNNMITAAGSYTALRTGFTSVGGSNLQSGAYWSSTTWENGSGYAWYCSFANGNWGYTGKNSESFRVRACLAFYAPKAAAEATAEDKGKLIGTDGNIYADVAAATAAGTTAVAKIIYIGATGHATYSHGLALALTDETGTMAWQAAIDACSAKNTSTSVTGATWLLASKAQWDYMLGASGAGSYTALRDGFSSVGGSNLQSGAYWSSTENEDYSSYAWYCSFSNGNWGYAGKNSDYIRARACLAF